MKKGIVEIVDLMVVTKADGELLDLAISTASEYTGALHLARTRVYHEGISPSVIVASSKSLHGISQAWESISQFRKTVSTSGEIHRKRKENLKYWMWRHLRDLIESSTRSNKDLQRQSKMIENDLYSGILPPRAAARSLYGQILTHGEGKLFKT
jgi:LAO/AO transport system kinase